MANKLMATIFGGAIGLYVLYSLLPSISTFLTDAQSSLSGTNAEIVGLTFILFLLVVVWKMADDADLV